MASSVPGFVRAACQSIDGPGSCRVEGGMGGYVMTVLVKLKMRF